MTTPHPLFPLEADDDEPIDVGWIHVTRHEAGGQRWAPRLFAAHELTDLGELAELYGGGAFELIARDGAKRTITGRRRYALPGRPKPLAPEDDTGGVPPQPAAPAPATGANEAILLAVLQMMQQQSAQQTQLVIALLTKADQGAKEHMQSMTALHDRFAQSQAQLMVTLLEAAKSGGGEGGGIETFLKGLEFAQELRAGIAEGQAEDDGGSDIQDLLEGMKAFAAMDAGKQQVELERIRLERERRADSRRKQAEQSPQPEGPSA